MATPTFGLTQNFENDIAGLMPDLMWQEITSEGSDPLVDALPLGYSDTSFVRWDQYENPYGLLEQRGLDAALPVVRMPGIRVNYAQPGYFGALTQLRESELVLERQPGTIADPLDVPERLSILLLNFSTMAVSRIRKMDSDLLLTGEFNIQNAAGQIVESYAIDNYRTFSPLNDGNTGPGWAAFPNTARPINDMIYWKAVLEKGTSSKFDQSCSQLCNNFVLVDLFKTQQIQQTYKNKFGATPVGLDRDGLNDILVGYDLPKLVPYNYGYYPTLEEAQTQDPSDFEYIIPNKSLIWVGKRPKGQKLGQFKLTRHAPLAIAGDIAKYPSTSVKDDSGYDWGKGFNVRTKLWDMTPVHYDIEMSFNACPVVYYGSAASGITYS